MDERKLLRAERKAAKRANKNRNRLIGLCAICSWHGPLTRHHSLFPRRKYRNHPLHSKLVIHICWPCHQMINDYFHQQECRYDLR